MIENHPALPPGLDVFDGAEAAERGVNALPPDSPGSAPRAQWLLSQHCFTKRFQNTL